MSNNIVKLLVSIVGGILCSLVAFASNYFIQPSSPKAYVFTLMGIVVLISYIVGVLLTMISFFTSPNKDKLSVGQIFVKAFFVPLMTFIMLLTFAAVPILMGILPPQFQSFPGEGMTFIGAFRGIPESMTNAIGFDAPPVAEMFYSFWGGVYGTSLAVAGF
jgi:hypothetical protein